jgi:hypothetical protein
MKIERMENLRKGIRDALHSPQRTQRAQRICILSGLCGNCFFIIAKGKKEVNSDCRLQILDWRLGNGSLGKAKGEKGVAQSDSSRDWATPLREFFLFGSIPG